MDRLDFFKLEVKPTRNGPTIYFEFYAHKERKWRKEHLKLCYKSVKTLGLEQFMIDAMPSIMKMIKEATPI